MMDFFLGTESVLSLSNATAAIVELRDQKPAGAALLGLRRKLPEKPSFEAVSFNRFVCSGFDRPRASR